MKVGIIFDFDDTLINFSQAEYIALNYVSKDLFSLIEEHLKNPGLVDFESFREFVLRISRSYNLLGIYDRPIWWKKILEIFNLDMKVDYNYLCNLTSRYWSIIAKNSKINDGAVELLTLLKKYGVKIGLLTNTDGECGNKKQRIIESGLHSYFDSIIIGGENGIPVKPNTKSFLRACESLGLDQCIMVGDDYFKDCLGAINAGLNAICLCKDINKMCAKDLRELSIILINNIINKF